ncbi:unnamed protein product [Didymodactylos carnosus]|uniref:Arginine and glutamate-rich protein 1 n=1 Tax=Didymodactylos carnosus TaxID=1234261 RepID=A0A8S2NF34_9BILA|nr:unnamed protein product [Didymodactylos carnosus]CAF3995264.1 unnamed protein product [Didymodactylos carnosus]
MGRSHSRSRSRSKKHKKHKSSRSKDRDKKLKRSRRHSSSASSHEGLTDGIRNNRISVSGNDLTARKKAEVERLAELERQRMQLLRQKEAREQMIQTEVERRCKELVDIRVKDELERRKDEIESEVKRRVDIIKKHLEKHMLVELEKRKDEEMKKLITKENRMPYAVISRLYISFV